MSAKDYFSYKKQLVPHILEAYHTLVAQYDIIVIEGAGSPAEINLKQEDIVNMGMAELVNAPVFSAEILTAAAYSLPFTVLLCCWRNRNAAESKD